MLFGRDSLIKPPDTKLDKLRRDLLPLSRLKASLSAGGPPPNMPLDGIVLLRGSYLAVDRLERIDT